MSSGGFPFYHCLVYFDGRARSRPTRGHPSRWSPASMQRRHRLTQRFIVWRLWTGAISDLADRFGYGALRSWPILQVSCGSPVRCRSRGARRKCSAARCSAADRQHSQCLGLAAGHGAQTERKSVPADRYRTGEDMYDKRRNQRGSRWRRGASLADCRARRRCACSTPANRSKLRTRVCSPFPAVTSHSDKRTIMVGQMYVQYQIPKRTRRAPIRSC